MNDLFKSSNWFKSTGTLIYDPHGRSPKSRRKVSDPWWVLLMCDQDIVNYANYWLRQKSIYTFRHSLYGSHISIVKGEEPPRKDLWKKYHGVKVSFEYSNAINDNGKYWWLFVKCPFFEKIRKELGLPGIPPYFRFHLTVGRKTP